MKFVYTRTIDKLTDNPSKFTGVDALTNKKLTLEPGIDANKFI